MILAVVEAQCDFSETVTLKVREGTFAMEGLSRLMSSD